MSLSKEMFRKDLSPREPDWKTGDLRGYPFDSALYPSAKERLEKSENPPVQQSDLLRPLLMDIAREGLHYAYEKYTKGHDHTDKAQAKHVIVVGAGMAGLAAAYELQRAGHRVTVLEEQTRVGGRVHTLREKDGLAKGLRAEVGAMRLPCPIETPLDQRTHFLTDYYAFEKFALTQQQFVNYSENAYLKFYDQEKVREKDWDDATFNELWPGWNAKIAQDPDTKDITNTDQYYDRTTAVVTAQLYKWLKNADNTEQEAMAWKKWIDIWSQFSFDGFLRSTYDAVKTKVPQEYWSDIKELDKYLPWPEAAVTAYSVYSYTAELDMSLVQYLRDQLGHWWSRDMHRIKGGMYQLPEAFADKIHDKIHFNHRVNEIVYTYVDPTNPKSDSSVSHRVQVKGYFTSSKAHFTPIEGDAVIVALPVNVIRLITFTPKPGTNSPKPKLDFYKAIEDIFTSPSTKIAIQTKTRFWEKEEIKGGFSKTNLPIGQVHYPSNLDGQHPGEKGLLLVYTWKTEALLFASLDPSIAVREVVEQLATIHPEIEEEFEVGKVYAWSNQQSTLGAFSLLKPTQFENIKFLQKPMFNLYFAGDGISFTTGWIQGALETGLQAAYQFYCRNPILSEAK